MGAVQHNAALRRKQQQLPLRPAGPLTVRALLAWYEAERRDLPWRYGPRKKADPYRVWLSEIMLQQTTVKAVVPYFQKFVARWPTVSALAAAPVGRGSAAMGGPRILLARPQSEGLRRRRRARLRRRISARRDRTSEASRHWPLHRRCHRGDRVRRKGDARRRQRRARRVAAVCGHGSRFPAPNPRSADWPQH